MMILRKTWFSYFTWGAFTAFLAAIVAMFWNFSGFLPEDIRIPLSLSLTVLTMLAVCLVSFAAGRLADVARRSLHPDPQILSIAGDVLAGLLLLGVFLVRISFLSRHVGEIADPDYLFEAAMVGAEGAKDLSDLLSILTVRILGLFLRIAGNRIIVASVAEAILQLLSIVCFYFGVRLLSGRVAAMIAAAVMGFLPTGYAGLLQVDTEPAFFMLFGLEFLLVALYLHFDARGSYGALWQIAWYVALGLAVGYMAYVDLATVILWIPLLLAFLILRNPWREEAVRLAIVWGCSLLMFLVMLIQEGGFAGIGTTFSGIWSTYFQGRNTVLIFHLPLAGYPLYITVLTLLSVVLVSFWRDRRRDHTTLWLLLFLAAVFLVPLFGPSRLNSQELLCFIYGSVLGAGVLSLIASSKRRTGRAQESLAGEATGALASDTGVPAMPGDFPVPEAAIPGAAPAALAAPEAPAGLGLAETAVPAAFPVPEAPAGLGLAETAPMDLPFPETLPMAGGAGLSAYQGMQLPQEAPVDRPSPSIASEARTVPEGMFLPLGDGMDDEEPRMRMPELSQSGPLGIDRGEEGVWMMEERQGQASMPGAAPFAGAAAVGMMGAGIAGAAMGQVAGAAAAGMAGAGAAASGAAAAGQLAGTAISGAAAAGQLAGTAVSGVAAAGQLAAAAAKPMTKAEQKQLAKAQKAQAKAAARARKEAKKAERERRRMMEEEEDYVAAIASSQPGAAPQAPFQPGVQPLGMPVAQPSALPGVPQAPVGQAPAGTGFPSLSELSPFAGKAPQTSQPNLVRNTAFQPDGSDDFDYEINGDDDFDV